MVSRARILESCRATRARALSPSPLPQSVAYNNVWGSSHDGKVALHAVCVNCCSTPVASSRTTSCQDPHFRRLNASRFPSGEMDGYLAGPAIPLRCSTTPVERLTIIKWGPLTAPAAAIRSPSDVTLTSRMLGAAFMINCAAVGDCASDSQTVVLPYSSRMKASRSTIRRDLGLLTLRDIFRYRIWSPERELHDRRLSGHVFEVPDSTALASRK